MMIKRIYNKLVRLSRIFLSVSLLPTALKKKRELKSYIRGNNNAVRVIVLTEHIGDIIACEPVSYYIKMKFPNDKIVWIINRKYKELLLMYRNVDKIVEVSCLSEWLYIKKLTPIQYIYDLHFNKRSCNRFFLKNVNKRNIHITLDNYYNYGSLLEIFSLVAGLPKLNMKPQLVLSTNSNVNFDLPSKYIVLQTQSNEICRIWNVDKWMQLVEMFPDYIFVELGMNSILRNGSNCITCLCGKLTLTDIAHIIKKSFLFIGIDSSMAHFANAFDIPTVVLLGKYHNFDKYIPYSGVSGKSNFLIISYPDIVANIPVSLVYENLIKLLA